MTKTVTASCTNGSVTIDSQPVAGAVILSKGIIASTGVALIDEDKVTYIASSAPDVDSTLSNLSTALQDIVDALTQISTTLTAIGAGMTGATTAPPPTLAAQVLVITTKTTALSAVKTAVDTMRNNLT